MVTVELMTSIPDTKLIETRYKVIHIWSLGNFNVFHSVNRSAFRSDQQIRIVHRIVFAVEQSSKAIRVPSFACNYSGAQALWSRLSLL